MKIIDRKEAINRRQDEGLMIVETPIYRVWCLSRTVLSKVGIAYQNPKCGKLKFFQKSNRIYIAYN
jgi:hypothetical protein